MASLFADPDFVRTAQIPADEDGRRELLAQWHKSKTAAFKKMVAMGRSLREASRASRPTFSVWAWTSARFNLNCAWPSLICSLTP
jgi:hypothetical protein